MIAFVKGVLEVIMVMLYVAMEDWFVLLADALEVCPGVPFMPRNQLLAIKAQKSHCNLDLPFFRWAQLPQ